MSPIFRAEKTKPWHRVLYNSIFCWLAYILPIPAFAGTFPPTEDVKNMEKKHRLFVVVEDLPDSDDAKLCWAKSCEEGGFIYGFRLSVRKASCDSSGIIKQV